MAHHVNVRPVRLRERDDGLACDKLRGIGYTWVCTCGERGKIMARHHDARLAGREHSGSAESGSSSAAPAESSG